MNEDLSTQSSQHKALASLQSIPRDLEGPVFTAPWQAEIFAITLSLHEQDVFKWSEWADILSTKIKEAQDQGDPDMGDTYYHHWLAALEQMIINKDIGENGQLRQLYNAWDEAAQSTPHGQAIELDQVNIP